MMKTPREIILERHRAAEQKLNAISAQELSSLAQRADVEENSSRASIDLRGAFEHFWRETFWPWRKIWYGLAAAWVVIAIVNFSTAESPSAKETEVAETRNPQVLAALREQHQMLVQLLEPATASTPAPVKVPGPRSEQRRELVIV